MDTKLAEGTVCLSKQQKWPFPEIDLRHVQFQPRHHHLHPGVPSSFHCTYKQTHSGRLLRTIGSRRRVFDWITNKKLLTNRIPPCVWQGQLWSGIGYIQTLSLSTRDCFLNFLNCCPLADEEAAASSSAFCRSNAHQSSFLTETAAVNSMQQQQRRSRKYRKPMALRDFHEHAITN